MLKLSHYVVASDRGYIDRNGDVVRLLYGTRQSKVVPVREDVLRDLQTGSDHSVDENMRNALRTLDILVPHEQSSVSELAEVVARNKEASAALSTPHIALLPASYCNMECAYCGQENAPGRLNPKHREAMKRRVEMVLRRPGVESMRIDWFGGEPLTALPIIEEMSQHFLHVAREEGVRYFAVIATNGSLLTKRTLLRLAKCQISHVEITLDGPPVIQDTHRPLRNGRKGSFDTIVAALHEIKDNPLLANMRARVRTNVDSDNVEFITELYDYMIAEGLSHPRIEYYLAPVHSWGNDVSLLALTPDGFAVREIEWLRQMESGRLHCELLPTRATKALCPATSASAEIISSSGRVFSCSEFPLVPTAELKESLGDVPALSVSSAPRSLARFDDWNTSVGNGERSCSLCLFFPTCGGACPKAWEEGSVPCPSYKFNLQGRLDLIAERNGLKVVRDV